MLKLTCLHKSTTHKLEIDASKGVPHLRAELHRLTGVEPLKQEIVGLSAGAVRSFCSLTIKSTAQVIAALSLSLVLPTIK